MSKRSISIFFLALLLVVALVACNASEGGVEGLTNFDTLVADSVTADTVTADEVVAGEVVFGDDDLYPVGFATDGQQLVYGVQDVTTSEVAAHGLTTVTWAICNLAEDPAAAAGAGAHCTVSVAANEVTINVWQDDFVTAAT